MGITETQVESNDSAALLAQAQAGGPEAFFRLGQQHEQRLFRQALALGGQTALAEDLVAETLIEAWKCLGRFDGSCRFSTWLYAILVHRFQKAVRSARSRPIALSALPHADAEAGEGLLAQLSDNQPLPTELVLLDELSVRLLSAIATLPGKHQQVVLLRFYEAASLEEIAAALGISTGTVKSRLHHALEKLRRIPTVMNLFYESRES